MSVTLEPVTIQDEVSGLIVSIVEGKHQNYIHIEHLPEAPVVDNRDFFFTKGGEFDGTGSSLATNRKLLVATPHPE
jgi:hypothetical protein